MRIAAFISVTKQDLGERRGMHAKSTMNARLALHQLMGLSSSASSTGTELNQILSARDGTGGNWRKVSAPRTAPRNSGHLQFGNRPMIAKLPATFLKHEARTQPRGETRLVNEEPALAARRDAVATSKLLVGALEILQAEVDRIKHQVGVSCPRSEERTAAEKELQDLRDLLEGTRVRCLGLSSLKRKVRRRSSA